MRRLTWMRYNHRIVTCFGCWMVGEDLCGKGYMRQPMQRTEYYMPWGVVTVDELHKMDMTRPLKKEADSLLDDSWFEGFNFGGD